MPDAGVTGSPMPPKWSGRQAGANPTIDLPPALVFRINLMRLLQLSRKKATRRPADDCPAE
jgi:hypothetical protein